MKVLTKAIQLNEDSEYPEQRPTPCQNDSDQLNGQVEPVE